MRRFHRSRGVVRGPTPRNDVHLVMRNRLSIAERERYTFLLGLPTADLDAQIRLDEFDGCDAYVQEARADIEEDWLEMEISALREFATGLRTSGRRAVLVSIADRLDQKRQEIIQSAEHHNEQLDLLSAALEKLTA